MKPQGAGSAAGTDHLYDLKENAYMTVTTQARSTPERTATQPTMAIADITVDPRYRRETGKLKDLQHSIRVFGLLRPVAVTADGVLLAGQRRLHACRNLGWDRIPVVIAHSDTEAIELIRAQREDGPCSKPASASELVRLGLHVEDLARPQAARRRAEGQAHRVVGDERGQSRDLAADVVGMSQHYYSQTRAVALAAAGLTGSPGSGERIPVEESWAEHSRIVLALIDRVYGGEVIETVSASGRRRRLSVNAIYDEWTAERRRRIGPERLKENSYFNADAAVACDLDIPIPAGPRTARLDQRKALAAAVATLTGLCHGVATIGAIDPATTKEEVASMERDLAQATRTLRALHNKIKEYGNGIA